VDGTSRIRSASYEPAPRPGAAGGRARVQRVSTPASVAIRAGPGTAELPRTRRVRRIVCACCAARGIEFSPNRYWLCAATDSCIKIWDLESKSIVDELTPEFPPVGKKAMIHHCISLCWSADGATLFSGYTDCAIRVWSVGIAR